MNKVSSWGICLIVGFGIAMLSSCSKDTDITNWSPTQALPADTTGNNNNNNNPIDTNQVQTFPFNWEAVLIGNTPFFGDSSSYVYTFDTLAAMHEFTCQDAMGRQMILRLADLNLGDHSISFDNTTAIIYIDNGNVFDTSFNPNGYINIFSNSNGRISAVFESDLNDNSGTGQDLELVNGMLQNAAYQ
jgi:hypothetical protein